MSLYQLDMDDSDAPDLAALIDEAASDGALTSRHRLMLETLASTIRAQIPIPVPSKIGAVVQTTHRDSPGAIRSTDGAYIRWALDSRTTSPWIAASDHEEPYRTDQIGRIVRVLSEGVDL